MALLASTTVTSVDGLVPVGSQGHGFRYNSLASPLALAANTIYIVGAEFGPGDPFASAPVGFATQPSITFLDSRFSVGPGLNFPGNGDFPTIGYFGANFQIAAVPELDSSSMMMPIGMTLFLLLGARRRRTEGHG